MQTEPDSTFSTGLLRDEEHLLAARLGPLKRRAGECFAEFPQVDAAKDALFAAHFHRLDFLLQAGIPPLANIIDLGEFGHGLSLAQNRFRARRTRNIDARRAAR